MNRIPDIRRAFSYSIASSLVSKTATVSLQVAVMPIAAISLGSRDFSLYAMLTAMAGWLSLANFGFGPSLTVKIAQNACESSISAERVIFSTAFFGNFLAAIGATILAIGLILIAPIQNIFGSTYSSETLVIQECLIALVLIFFFQLNLTIFESAQAGYQQQYVFNFVVAASVLPTILLILLVSRSHPTPLKLILALNVPNVIARLIHVLWFVRRKRNLVPSPRSFSWSLCRENLSSGLSYSLAGSASNFLAHSLPVILIGRNYSPVVAASFAATMNLIVLLSGMCAMIYLPLWPAMAASYAQGNLGWASLVYKRVLRLTMTFAVVTMFALYFFGGQIFDLWYQGSVHPAKWLLAVAGLYFVASTWEGTHFNLLIGLGRIRESSLLVFRRAFAGALVIWIVIEYCPSSSTQEWLPLLIMALSIVLLNATQLRRFVRGQLGSSFHSRK